MLLQYVMLKPVYEIRILVCDQDNVVHCSEDEE